MRCAVFRCPGAMGGQMLSCAAHWSFLPEELRLELVAAYDKLAAEERVANPRRDTRLAWKALIGRALEQWDHARRRLEEHTDAPLPPSGMAWLRVQHRLDEEAAAAAAVEVPDGG